MKTHPFRRDRKHSDQRGIVLVTVMLAVAGLMAIALVVASQTSGATRVVRHEYQQQRVFYAAEGGADYAQAWLVGVLASNPTPTQAQLDAFAPPSIAGFRFDAVRINKEPIRHDVPITDGPNRGMTANIQPYEIVSHAVNISSNMEQIVHVRIEQELIDVSQFGIYYNSDLEIFPNFPLDYMGRIHCNGNVYCGSHNTLDLNTQLTAAGHIYNTAKDPTLLLNGKVRFMDSQGQWHDLSYDSRDPNWVSKSMLDWDGNVQDSAHGVTPLSFPIPLTSDPHDIIERPVVGEPDAVKQKKFYYKAGLRIIDGVASDSLGNVVTLPSGIITNSPVYDYREQKTMQMRNLDMAALISANLVPANHCIYIAYTHDAAAIRIKNATSLPSGGIVLATENPLYIQGHYNTVNKQPSSLLCDAINVYSSIWSDANATLSLTKRVAAATTVNTCVAAGNSSTTPANYGGGAENLIRLHEKWVGHELTFRGSLICLWVSEQATGSFANASYVEAQRDWAFDPDLLDPDFWPQQQLFVSHIVRARWWTE